MKVKDLLVVPPSAPYQWWMTPQLKPLHEKFEAWRRHKQEGGKYPHTEFLSDEEWLLYHALRGKQDLYFLGKYVMGFDRLEAPFHVDLAYAWTRPTGDKQNGITYGPERMALLQRGGLKTTLLDQAYVAQVLANDPEARILIYSASGPLAEGMLAPVKLIFQGQGRYGQFFVQCYPYLIPKRSEQEKWTNQAIIVKRKGAYTDPSVKAAGVGSVLTSGHFTHQIVDDIVGEELSRQMMDKVIKSYDGLVYLYSSIAEGQRRIIGTRWAFFDIYAREMRKKKNVLVALRSWMEKDGKPTKEYTPENLVFKQKWAARDKRTGGIKAAQAKIIKRGLEERSINPYLFSCQYENNPRDESKLGFNEAWWRYARREGDFLVDLDADGHEERKIRLAACNVYIIIDPNTGRKPGERTADNNIRRSADFVGIIVLAVAPDHTWYVLRAYRKRWGVDVFVDKTFTLVDIWSPKKVIMEQRAAQIVFLSAFRAEFKRGRPTFVIEDFKGGNDSKEERIKALIPKYSHGMIRHLEGSVEVNEGMTELEEELLDFPNADYDDISDALSGAIGKVYAPGHIPLADFKAKQRHESDLDELDEGSARAWRSIQRERDRATNGFDWFGGDRIEDQ